MSNTKSTTAIGLLVYSVALAHSTNTLAEEGWYVNGSYYQSELKDAANKDAKQTTECTLGTCNSTPVTQHYTSSFDSSTHGGIAVGYSKPGHYRSELEYRQHRNDISGADVPATDTTRDTRSVFINGWYDFQLRDNFYPYLGGGLGFSEVKQADMDNNLFGIQLGVGLAWHFTNRFAVDISYRYVASLADASLSNMGKGRRLESEHEGQTTLIGIRYNFFGRHIVARDTDGDGVVDFNDECSATPRDVAVNDAGCAIDSDHDGIPNHIDQCPNSEINVNVNKLGCEEIATLVLDGINFELNSALLTNKSADICERVAGKLATIPGTRYEVQGHTDSQGNSAYNMRLSQSRAEAIRECLIDNGIEGTRLRAVGYGHTNPVAGNDSRDGRAQNRRVQLQKID